MDKTPKTFNARFESEVMWAIADLLNAKYGRDKTDVVARAIMEAKERLGGTPVRAPQSERPHAQSATPAPFNPLCRHCGQPFGAFNRFASLCPACKAERHVGEPRECPACNSGSAI